MKITSGRRPATIQAESFLAGGADLRYVETSALLAAILDGDRAADEAIRGEGTRVASALTFAEARRAIVRGRVTGRISAAEERSALKRLKDLEDRVDIAGIDARALERIGRPFPAEPIRALDAIHLATVELLDASPPMITVVSCDRRVVANARAMGFVVE